MIFVNSMSDLFHKDIDRTFIDKVFDAMEQANWHVYQVLTKRSSLMRNYVRKRYDGGSVPRHIWLGVSVEDAAYTSRIEHLKQINSDARFISFEPLLGPVGDVDLGGIAWAIVGGESGGHANDPKHEHRFLVRGTPGRDRRSGSTWLPIDSRTMHVRHLRDAARAAGCRFFFKQHGGLKPGSAGRELDGRTWDELPTVPGALPLRRTDLGGAATAGLARKRLPIAP